ncbi:MAG: 23S rRNA (pseudouridine(1915)-N(3))-methyltransferase RlmH [Pseudomonadota bacterium]
MRLVVAAVGKLKSGADKDLYERYAGRCAAGRQIGVTDFSLIEIQESRAERRADRMAQEADGLLSKLKPDSSDAFVLLDEGGAQLSSDALAQFVQARLDVGTARLIFAIGGPDGHGDAIRLAAAKSLSLSKMTLPHGLARIVLAEQIYRAITILTGHPYHRA